MNVMTFVEVQNVDGSWSEAPGDSGFLDGYSAVMDGYINRDLYVSLVSLKDGYGNSAETMRRSLPLDRSPSLDFKLSLLKYSNPNIYWFYVAEINNYPWTLTIPGSELTVTTTYGSIAADFLSYYLPALNALGDPTKVRFFVAKSA